MKKIATIKVGDGKTYKFEFANMSAFSDNIVRLDGAKCSLWNKTCLFNAGVIICFNNAGSMYINMTEAKYVGFAHEE